MQIQNRAQAIWVVALITVAATAGSVLLSVLAIPANGVHADWQHWVCAAAVPLILAPIFSVPLVNANMRLVKMHRQLERMALTDSMTGLPNRRAFFKNATRAFAAADAADRPVALMMIDVDQLKTINDLHGHDMGDEMISTIGASIRDAVRAQSQGAPGFAARLGGDEFVVLIAGADRQSIVDVAARIGEQVRGIGAANPDISVATTVSIGVAMRKTGEDVDTVLRAADKAAYEAKRAGRDRLVMASDGQGAPEAEAPPAATRPHPRAA